MNNYNVINQRNVSFNCLIIIFDSYFEKRKANNTCIKNIIKQCFLLVASNVLPYGLQCAHIWKSIRRV